ncbi:MDR family MFS transporter [Luteipulveratus flavus]|uniref:MDR family MFS transporter n=1 Tax=Luteipulveratus flavus TaxID=3031728 RepID=A0ABT6C1X7_9MICO|nr:MDR family MFS transporter [Luteipulveratus sp. YIM 133296]MDF8262775.1 MDR family MFS transporter [Luteipulveratus sp. YIM 133296]
MTTASEPASGELSHREILTILVGLLMGMFLAALDQTIVGTAIRTIADDLQGLSVQAWVTTAYLITSTITTPIYGKLGDLYGRKKLFLFAITVFIVGSALCSFATSMYVLAAFRAVQGIGAGGLMTLVLAIIGDLVPPRERARYTGYFMAVFGTTSVLGPVVGGFFAEADTLLGISGWRWVFLINVPLGILALFVVNHTLHLEYRRREARIDWWGAASLVVALVPLLTVAEQGREWGWGSGRSLAAYAIGAVGVIAFVLIERAMGDDALIPLRIFRIRAVAVTIVASIIVGMAMFGGIIVLPQYMQIVHGASPMESGFLMLPMVLGLMIAGVFSGQVVSRTGIIRPLPIVGTALGTVALALMWQYVHADTTLVLVMAFMLLFGLGLGNCMQPLTLIAQNSVPPQEIGVATSSATFFRQMGGTLGVAVFLSVLFSTVGDNIATALRQASSTPEFRAAAADPAVLANPANRGVVEALRGGTGAGGGLSGVLDDSSVISRMDSRIAHPFKVGFADSMDLVFLCAAVVMLLGFLVLLLMPHVELRAQSASQAARTAPTPGTAAPAAPAGATAAAEPEPEAPRERGVVDDVTQVCADVSAGHTMDELPAEDEPTGGRRT